MDGEGHPQRVEKELPQHERHRDATEVGVSDPDRYTLLVPHWPCRFRMAQRFLSSIVVDSIIGW